MFRLEQAVNDPQFERQFLHVPPAYPAESTDAVGSSPMLPSKQNPVFRLSTKKIDAIPKCRPYPLLSQNTGSLIAQLGIDESVVSRRLETALATTTTPTKVERQNLPVSRQTHLNNPTPVILQSRIETRNLGTQTPSFTPSCARCERRQSNMMNGQTQTPVIEKRGQSSQTSEADFQLAKLRLGRWEKQQNKVIQNFKREYAEAFDEDVELERRSPPKPRAALAPPGFRETMKKETAPATNSTTNRNNQGYYDSATIRRFYDKQGWKP